VLLPPLLPLQAAAIFGAYSTAAAALAAAAAVVYVVYFFLSPTCSPLSVKVSGCCSRKALNLVDRPSGRFTCSDQADEANMDAVSGVVDCIFRQGFGCFTSRGEGVLQQEGLELGGQTLRALHHAGSAAIMGNAVIISRPFSGAGLFCV
jgi:hypothetical protein